MTLATGALLAAALPMPVQAQSRIRVTGGLGLAGGTGDLGRLTGLGMSGTLAVGVPVDERITIWIEGSADALSVAVNENVSGFTEFMTRYLVVGEYRVTWPWSPWRFSATLGAGATTFWDNAWLTFHPVGDDPVQPLFTTTVVRLSGTHFTVAPGFRASYSIDPNFDLELVGRYSLAMHGGESFRIDESGARTDLEPPGSPTTSWALTFGGRLRARGPPSEWTDLEPGDRVRAWGSDGSRLDGRLVSVDDRRLRLSTDSGITDMALENVQSAASLYSRADRGGLIGGAVLGALGFGLGYLAGQGLCDKADCSGEGVEAGIRLGLIAGIGGFIFGGLIGSATEGWREITSP